jgi:hypothetical protein
LRSKEFDEQDAENDATGAYILAAAFSRGPPTFTSIHPTPVARCARLFFIAQLHVSSWLHSTMI